MNNAADLAVEGNVLFSVEHGLPRWPELCVVCGESCVETCEFYSVVEVNRGTRFAHDVRGTHIFQVPVHATVKDCRAKLLHPKPLWAYLPPLLFGVAVGAFMGYIAKPDWASRMGAFTIFGAIAAFIGWIPVLVIFDSALEIDELGGTDCVARFKDQAYARRFAELNPDLVKPITRPAWDISINLFPKRKKAQVVGKPRLP